MKLSIKLFCINLCAVVGLFAQTNTKNDLNMLISASMYSGDKITNIMFFTNSSYSVEEIQNGSNNKSISLTLPTQEYQSLEKLIKGTRPLVLRDKYSCNGKPVDRENAIIYQFAKSMKKVMIDNACKTPKKLNELTVFIKGILAKD